MRARSTRSTSARNHRSERRSACPWRTPPPFQDIPCRPAMARRYLRSTLANNCSRDRPTVKAYGMCRLQPPFCRYLRADAAVALQGGDHHSLEFTGALLPGVTDDRYRITCVEICRKGRDGHGATSSTTNSHPPCVAARATVDDRARG